MRLPHRGKNFWLKYWNYNTTLRANQDGINIADDDILEHFLGGTHSDFRTAVIILCMRLANERRRYGVTLSLIGWAHTENDLWDSFQWIPHSVVLALGQALPCWRWKSVILTSHLWAKHTGGDCDTVGHEGNPSSGDTGSLESLVILTREQPWVWLRPSQDYHGAFHFFYDLL